MAHDQGFPSLEDIMAVEFPEDPVIASEAEPISPPEPTSPPADTNFQSAFPSLEDIMAVEFPEDSTSLDPSSPDKEAVYLQDTYPSKPWRGTPSTELPIDTTPDTFLGAIAKGAENLSAVFKNQAGGALQYISEAKPSLAGLPGYDLTENAAALINSIAKNFKVEDLGEKGKKLSAEAKDELKKNALIAEQGSLPYYGYSGVIAGGLMIPTLIATYLTKSPVPLVFMGGQVAAGRYAESIAKGRTHEEASLDGMVYGTSEFVGQILPFGVFLKEGGKFVWRAVKGGVYESGEEVVNELIQLAYDWGVLKEDMTAAQVKQRLKDAAILGGGLGLAITGAFTPLARSKEKPPPPPDGEENLSGLFKGFNAGAYNRNNNNVPPNAPPPAGGGESIGDLQQQLTDLEAEVSGEPVAPAASFQGDFFNIPDTVPLDTGLKNQPNEVIPGKEDIATNQNQGDLFDETTTTPAEVPPKVPAKPDIPPEAPPAGSAEISPALPAEVPSTVPAKPEAPTVEGEIKTAVETMSGAELTKELKALGVEKIPHRIASRREVLQLERDRTPELTPEAVELAANEAATSPENNLPLPSDDQKEAGNYKKGRLSVNGLDIAIENPAGSKRQPEWPALKDHYGDIKQTIGTEGNVGEGVDVFVNSNSNADIEGNNVFVVDQYDKDGTFDEHKVVFGAENAKQAKAIYNRNYEKGWDQGKAVTEYTWDEFKAWLPKNKNVPAAPPIMPTAKVKKAPPIVPEKAELTVPRAKTVTAELIPSTSVDQLPWIHQAPFKTKQKYSRAAAKIIQNEKGEDLILQKIGAPADKVKESTGTFEGAVNPNVLVDIRDKETADLYSNIFGLIYSQDAVPWHAAKSEAKGKNISRGKAIRFDKPLTQSLIETFYNHLDTALPGGEFTVVGEEIRVINFRDENGKPLSGVDTTFLKAVDKAVDTFKYKGKISVGEFGAESNYLSNNWGEQKNGEAYRSRITAAGRSDLFDWIRYRRTKVGALQKRFSNEERRKTGGQRSRPSTVRQQRPEVDSKGKISLTHWSDASELITLDPKYSGTGIKGAESKRKANDPKNFIARTYYGLKGYAKETGLGSNTYETSIDPKELYDFAQDPDTLAVRYPLGGVDLTRYEKAIADAGYTGYFVNQEDVRVAAIFKSLDVAPVTVKKQRTPLWKSALLEQVTALGQSSAPAAQWKASIQKLQQKGVKQEEIQWSGVMEWLDTQKGKVTEEAMLNYLAVNQVELSEKILAGPGGPGFEGRTERMDALITRENAGDITKEETIELDILEQEVARGEEGHDETQYSEYQMPGAKENYTELVITAPLQEGETYSSSHWENIDNAVVHLRFNERTIEGKRTLFIEEIQSDLHQLGRKYGYQSGLKKPQAFSPKTWQDMKSAARKVARKYDGFGFDSSLHALHAFVTANRDSSNNIGYPWFKTWDTSDLSQEEIATIQLYVENKVETDEYNERRLNTLPDAPFKESRVWGMVGVKRAIRWAIDNNIEQIAWTPGEVQSDRYDLSKHISAIRYLPYRPPYTDKTEYEISVTDVEGHGLISFTRSYNLKQVEDTFGKDIAEKIQNGEGVIEIEEIYRARTLKGVDLKVGGEGMKGFYDKILPSAVNKFIKKFGAKVGVAQIEAKDVWTFPITEKMKDTVGSGVAMFQQASKTLTNGVTQKYIDELQAEVDQLNFKMPVKVIASRKDLSWGDMLSEDGATDTTAVWAEFADGSSRIYVFADKTRNAETAIVSAIHEAVGHAGLRSLFTGEKGLDQKAFDDFLDAVYKDQAKRIAKTNSYRELRYDLSDTTQRREATEEFFAYTAQNLVGKKGVRVPDWLTKLFIKLKQILRKLHIPNINLWGRAELLDLISRANHAARRTETVRDRTGEPVTVRQSNLNPDNPTVRHQRQQREDTFSAENIRDRVKTRVDIIRLYLQDKSIEIKRKQKSYEVAVPESQDAYQAISIYDSVAGERLNTFDEERIQVLLEQIAVSNLDITDVGEWLVARHASEANAYLYEINPDMGIDPAREKLSGMSNKEAKAILDKYADNRALQIVGDTVDLINKESLRQMVQDQLLAQFMADNWAGRYQHYVPLMREEAESFSDSLPGRGEGFSLKGRESKQRTGSAYWTPTNIVSNVLTQAQLRITRGEKNKVSLALLEQVEAHPDPAFWKVVIDPTHRGVVQRKTKEGIVREVKDIPDFQLKPNQLSVKRKGEQVIVEFTRGNPRAERMIKGLKNLDAPDFGPVIRTMSSATRFLAQVYTAWNPEFAVTNFIRDIQTAGYNLTSTELKNTKIKVLTSVPAAMMGIIQGMRGNITAPWAKVWNEFLEAGGKTGWIDLHQDVKVYEKNLQRIVNRLKAGKPPKQLIRRFFDGISNANTVVENGVRLSAYKAARDIGMSPAASAALAKDLTVNFNRKGLFGPAMNAWYVFFNANVQGQFRMIETMATSKMGRRAAYATILFAFMLDMANRLMAGEDDDGQNLYDALPDYIKARNVIFWGFGGRKEPLIKFAAPWGYNVFHLIGQAMGAATTRQDFNIQNEMAKLFFGIIEAFNPVGSGDLLQLISPTVLDPAIQIGTNKDWAGRPVKPEVFPSNTPKPFSQQYFRTATETSKDIARKLNEVEIRALGIEGGTTITPGTLDFSPEWFDLLFEFSTGGTGKLVSNTLNVARLALKEKKIPVSTIPFVRKVTGYDSQYGVKSRYYEWSREIGYTKLELNALKGKARSKLRDTPKGSVVSKFSSTEKSLRKLRNQRKKAVGREDQKRVGIIDERIRRLMVGFNIEYREKVLGFK